MKSEASIPEIGVRPARSGRNINGYFGEAIEINAVLADCKAFAQQQGWRIEEISTVPKPRLLALIREIGDKSATGKPVRRIYISAGIHGDEPAGPLAIRKLLEENIWPTDVSLWVLPCLNPTGFALNRRENLEGRDLNRDYLEPKSHEVKAHIEWLRKQPTFDLCLSLHEDWEAHGFYVYELNPDRQPSRAEAVVSAVADVCPIDPSEVIEGRAAEKGIIRPDLDPRSRPQWPESFYLLRHKTQYACTLEAPSDYSLSTRVAALVTGVRAAVAVI